MSELLTKPMSIEDVRRLKSDTDWERLKRDGDDQNDAEFDVDWSNIKVAEPIGKKAISLRVDSDILAFFKAQGKGYQTRMNAVLRAYMKAQQ